MSSLKEKLLLMSLDELEDELIESNNNYVKQLVIKKIIKKKEDEIKNKVKIKKTKKRKSRNSFEKMREEKEYLRAEDFLDDILAIDDDIQEEEQKEEINYDPLLIDEVRKDAINNRVMDRLNSDIFIKKTSLKRKKIESPYVDNSDDYYDNPSRLGIDPYDFSNRRFIKN